MIVGPIQAQMDDFCDLHGTPDTPVSRIVTVKVVYLAFFGIFMLLQMSVSKILAHRHLWYFKTTKILKKKLQP